MNLETLFYAVLTISLLSGSAASAIALSTRRRDPARMAVALHLAKIAFIGAAALAALLGSSIGG